MTIDEATVPTTAPDTARSLRPVLERHAAETDAAAVFPLASVEALRAGGLFGLLVPRRYGGLGGDLRDLTEVAQILAGGCLSTAMIWATHCQQTDVLVRHAGPRLRDALLPRIARGELYLTSVTTGPDEVGHLLGATAPLRRQGRLLSLDREAPVVTGGEHADGFLVTMRADENSTGNRVSLVYADRAQLRLEIRTGWDALGMRGTRGVGVRLRGDVPADQVVGEPGGFRDVATDSMTVTGHLGWAACWLGTARSALAGLVGLPRSPRRQPGAEPRSDLAAERLARVRLDLELAGAYLHRVRDEVAALRTAGEPLGTPAVQIHLNTLKVAVSELTFSAVDRMIQLTGLPTGYLKDAPVPLERHLRDLRSAALTCANDHLLTATGPLVLLDRPVQLA
ncbi:acyl-CoA dehydrogenase family protein [Streptomyces sp. MST-110588]|uniref:acyl-CoA dehydrogenase family protein n=1 Tax=Streptomyces sp. MST-110588 TaxID=2833628 RepID=UPI001F5DDBBC|nr:acyl-CoA dehydrogenase family protein [Streptomyces sp. MST-110588]UNO38454.1 acyl-CoA/acyl-ACP dehydrogenase [Streptomyces sp. MST-110588]